ncbi:hypothetical protein HZB74_00425 [Candidatus Saccharibacteria bacterium]|nr:hypothetical protein [Candidatus Saccharibacteria bacterium]
MNKGMERGKALAIGVASGAGLFVYANDFANMHEKLLNSHNKGVEACSRNLGAVAVEKPNLPVECKPFANKFTNQEESFQLDQGKSHSTSSNVVSYSFPNASDFKIDNTRTVKEKNKNMIALAAAGGGAFAFVLFGGLVRSRNRDRYNRDHPSV